MKPVLNQLPQTNRVFPAEKHLLLVLALVWLGMQVYLFNSLGIKIVYDSRHFIGSAELFVEEKRGLFGFRSSYDFYVLIISFFLKFGNLKALIGFQVLLSGLATSAFYFLVRKVSGSYVAAFTAVFIWVAWADLQRWNFYVLTESVFLSLLLFLICTLVYLKRSWHWPLLVSLLLMLSLTRPNGFLLIPVILIALGVKYTNLRKSTRYLMLVGSILLLPLWLWLANKLLQNMGGKAIIWQYPLGYIIQGYKGLLVTPGSPLDIPEEVSPLTGLWLVIQQDWLYFFKISFLKLFF